MTSKIFTNTNAFIATFPIDPAKRSEFETMFNARWTSKVDQLEKIVNFVFYGWGRNENEFVAIESWKDEDTLNAWRATEDFQKGIGKLLVYCNGPLTMQIFSGLNMPRTVFELYPKGQSKRHPSAGEITSVFL